MTALRLIGALLLPLAVLAQAADDEPLSIPIAQASLRQQSLTDPQRRWVIEVQFSAAITAANLSSAAPRFELFDLTDGHGVATLPANANPAVTQNRDLPQVFEITLAEDALNPTQSYVLYAVDFLANGQPVDDLHAKLQFLRQSVSPSMPGTTPPAIPPPVLQQGMASSKDDSDVYVNGEADWVSEAPGSRIANAIADVKLSIPFFANWRELQVFSPQFLLDASTVPGHNPNSMSFGLTWDSFTPLSWLIFRKDFLVESTTNFQISDGIFAPTVRLPLPDRWFRHFALVPFAGGEFGGSFNNPLRPASGAPIARGLFGADLTAYFHLENTKAGLKGIGFEAQWLRRVLAQPEITVNDFNPGDYTLATFDRHPHDHAFVKVKFALTDTFGFTVSYENGQLPPSYQFVHNMVKIGLLYQAQIKARP